MLHGASQYATLSATNGQRGSHGRIFWECCAVVRGLQREVRLGRPALGVALRENLLRMRVRGRLMLADRLEPAEADEQTDIGTAAHCR
jgi:hypothetical protein